jgi:hypothetical protein
VPVSVGFMSWFFFLGHVHAILSYISYNEFLLPAQWAMFSPWAVFPVKSWLLSVETIVLHVLSFVSISCAHSLFLDGAI